MWLSPGGRGGGGLCQVAEMLNPPDALRRWSTLPMSISSDQRLKNGSGTIGLFAGLFSVA